jgi:hypothetical protein
MSAGLIPVTRNKGGVIDFVPKEYMFNEINEAVSKIDCGIKNWNFYSMRMMKELTDRFSLENYEKNLLDIVDKYL